MVQRCSKELSANDLGLTGGHQAGIAIPKNPEILGFFPPLDSSAENPRAEIMVTDRDSGEEWRFPFIYYNNKLRGGTRNEYRLTHMTRYLASINAALGDHLVFERDEEGLITVWLERSPSIPYEEESGEFVIVLTGKWKRIRTRYPKDRG